MRKFTLFVFVFLLLVFHGTNAASISHPDSVSNTTLDVNFGNSVTQNFSNTTSIKPDLPDIGTYVDNNLTDFSSDGTQEYVGNDVVNEISESFYQLNITLTNVAVVDDKDGSLQGAGEIFVEGRANGNSTRYPAIGDELSLNDNENINVSASLLLTTAFSYNITFEIREADSGNPDDSLGFVTYTPVSITNDTLVLQSDTGDATLTFEVVAYLQNDITAQHILDGSRPYLHIDDETGDTELPDDLVGRIIIGDDGPRQAMVLQYYFYWNAEYSPDGGVYSFKLHENDFEAFYVYYDLNNLGDPYRLVFNNYIYTQLPGFPNENLLIIEEGAVATESNFTTTMNADLQLLLGVTTQQEADYLPMSSLSDWEYDTTLNRRADIRTTSLLGSTTVELTVDTSYHTFDLGPGGAEYGFDYNTTSELNDTRIKSWYGIIEDTFNNGTRNWSYVGIDIPEVAPFTFDVTQVFTAPHVITGYSTVSEDTAAIERAKNSYLNITQSLDIFISYNFPSSIDLTYDNEITAGSTSIMTLQYNPSSELEISVGFEYRLSANLSFWLVQASYNQVFNGTLDFDIDTGTVSSLAELLGLDSFEVEDRNLSSYLSLTGLTINPQLFGTILEGSLELDLWNIIETILRSSFFLATPILDAIDYLLDSFTLSLDFAVSGVVTVPLSTSNNGLNLNTTEIVFTEESLIQAVEIEATPDFSINTAIILGNISYGLNFTVDWVISFALRAPLNNYVADFSWTIGVFPDYTAEINSSPGTSLSVNEFVTSTTPSTSQSSTITSQTTSETSSSEGNNEDSVSNPSPLPVLTILGTFIAIPILKRKYHTK